MSNLLQGSTILSPFKAVRGYLPSIIGIGPVYITEELRQAHAAQEARRHLHMLLRTRAHYVLSHRTPNTKVYVCVKRSPTKKTWYPAFVQSSHPHFLMAQRVHEDQEDQPNPNKYGRPIQAAWEDIRIQPESPLLKELDAIDHDHDESEETAHNNNTAIQNGTTRGPKTNSQGPRSTPSKRQGQMVNSQGVRKVLFNRQGHHWQANRQGRLTWSAERTR